jgi:excisionase family DNA binding protein
MFTDESPLLTNEVAQLLAVSPDTVRCWERAGRLPARKTEGGVRLFDRRVVERFALERKRQTVAGEEAM